MAVVKFSKQLIQPNPLEVDYWVDIAKNPYGAIIKYYNGEDWVQLNGSGGSASDFDFYTKTQINQMLANKADVDSVESKVDDAELSEVIKNIEIKDLGDDTLKLVIFKYDNTRVALTLPTATATNPGILSANDFVNFVKQYQLQDLYTEMYDTFEDVRAKYQPRLKAGKKITIDRGTNTIDVVDDLKIQWYEVRSKPDFHKVSTTGDYNDLRNKLTPGIGIEIDNYNVISTVPDIELYQVVDKLPTTNIDTSKIYLQVSRAEGSANIYTEYAYVDGTWKILRTHKANIDLSNILSIDAAEATYVKKTDFEQALSEVSGEIQALDSSVAEAITKSESAVDVSYDFAQVAQEAKTTAEAARNAIASLEGLTDVDASALTVAQLVAQIETNAANIEYLLNRDVKLAQSTFDALETKDVTKHYFIYDDPV